MGDFDPMGWFGLLNPLILTFGLILTRLGGVMISAPIFSGHQFPVMAKAGFAILVSFLLMNVIGIKKHLAELHFLSYVFLIVIEFAIGIIIGLVISISISSIEFAGRLFGIQMGLAMANVVDPTTSEQTSVLSQILKIFFYLLFLSLDGHLMILQGFFESFKILPLARGHLNIVQAEPSIYILTSKIISVAMKIALPITSLVLFINTALGILSKVVPQVNVFVLGVIVNIGAGFVMLGLAMPSFGPLFQEILMNGMTFLADFLKELSK
jgi:flagellar biosynthetic protein FliR